MTVSTRIVCDECGDEVGRAFPFYLHIEPRHAGSENSDIFFFDGSWNGGDFCSKECAHKALGHISNPGVRA